MIEKFIVIDKNSICEKDISENKPVHLWVKLGNDLSVISSSRQLVLRLNKSNDSELRDHVRYSKGQIKVAASTFTDLKEKKDKVGGNSNSAFAEKVLTDGSKLFKRYGSFSDINTSPFTEVLAGQTEIIEVEVGFDHVKIESMELVGAGKLHSCSLYVLDDDDGSYSGQPRAVLNQFAYNSCVAEGLHSFKSKYDADLYRGMSIHVEITNYSDTISYVGLNLDLNEVVKVVG